MSGLVVILLSVRNVVHCHRGRFIVVVLSLLSCRDVFVYGTSLGQSCSVEEKFEFKKGEDVLEEVVKFCYLGDMISC